MNFYKFHIGDFVSATVHLSPMEELAYRRLLDMYYDTECPIPLETDPVSRRLRIGSDVVEIVLKEFFFEQADGWHNSRCDAEIERYRNTKEHHWGKSLTKEQRCAMQAARNAAKINATPRWLTADHHAEIARIYADCRRETDETCVPHEVDHIIPLRGIDVCGLHVPWNLRVITAYENRRKSNFLAGVA